MKVFFHHVGQAMAARDFPKTVFGEVPLIYIAANLPIHTPRRDLLLSQLQHAFPEGRCNVWGVPDGARGVITRMEVGDCVLLLGLAGLHGLFPAMGIVRVFLPESYLDLSTALWGEDRFPLVFFFKTEKVHYTWPSFTDDMNYKSNWRPAGMFYQIGPERLASFGGAAGYVNHIRRNHVA